MESYLSEKIIKRLTLYHFILDDCEDNGLEYISSPRIAELLGIDNSQVRKDIKFVNHTGKCKIGYKVSELKKGIEILLGFQKNKDAFIIGAGNLGTALIKYDDLKNYGLNILAAFDIAVAEPVASPKGKYIYPVSELDSFCSEHNARIGIIAVPAEAAQQACNELYNAGIKMMLCLAPCKLIPPNDTIIRYENIAQSLAVLKAQSL